MKKFLDVNKKIIDAIFMIGEFDMEAKLDKLLEDHGTESKTSEKSSKVVSLEDRKKATKAKTSAKKKSKKDAVVEEVIQEQEPVIIKRALFKNKKAE